VTIDSGEIYDLKDSPAPPAAVETLAPLPSLPPRPNARRNLGLLRLLAKILTWAMVITFLLGGARWAFHAGMDQRRDIWQSTRSIRFKEDISRGYSFGNDVLRFAESQANLESKADALADQSPGTLARAGYAAEPRKSSPTFRRLTAYELMHGLVAYMDDVVQNREAGNYDLDYPPLRLAVMTLWVRHIQRLHPDMDEFPQQRGEDGPLGQDEDVAEPLLRFNAYCAAAAAIAMFFLICLWVHRSFQPARPLFIARWWRKSRPAPNLPPARTALAPRWTVPHGIFAFMLATGGFWYAYLTLVHLPARPTPMISVAQIQPGGAGGATIIANINSQDQDTQWHIDFGTTPYYGRASDSQAGEQSLTDEQYSTRLQPLERGQTVHFRVAATSPAGTTRTDDFSFINNDGAPIDINSTPVGGIDWPTWTVWLRLLALFILMVLAAQMLPPIHRGWACGAVAAMLIWCDPLLLIDSHAWPQWDVWILPFFLVAVLMASLNWWLVAGICLGIGCMFKGQLLLAGPILILWPLFAGRWGAVARVVIGFLLGVEMITWPWLVNSPVGFKWIEWVGVAAGLILLASLMRRPIVRHARRWIVHPLLSASGNTSLMVEEESILPALLLVSAALVAAIFSFALIFHGISKQPLNLPGGTTGLFFLLVLLPPWFLPRRAIGFWLAGVLTAAVWICAQEFNGSYSWATLGYAYGSVKHDQMQMSIRNFSNLTSILSQNYQWDIHDTVGNLKFSFTTPGPWRIGHFAIPSVAWAWSSDLDVKNAMAVLYGIALIISSAAAALHSRRNDRRFLVAMVVPWIVFPVIMCQMGDRYPIWASCISASMVAVSLELSLLHVVLAVVSFAMVARQLVAFDPNRWPQLIELMTPTFPGLGWLLLLVAAIFFFAALVPSRRCAADL